jgi:hypothetical protein
MRNIIGLAGAVALAALTLTGCSAAESTTPDAPATVEDTGMEEVNYVLPDGRFIECFDYITGSEAGTLTCGLLPAGAPAPQDAAPAADDYEIVYLKAVSGSDYTCLDYISGSKAGVFACVPSAER